MPIEAALFGTLAKDGELKTSKAGKQYLSARVAVADGEKTQWIGVRAFDEKAIANAAAYCKSARVYCEGKLSLDEWAGQDGVQRHGLSLMSWYFRLAEIGRNKPKREKAAAPATPQSGGAAPYSDEIPFSPEWR